MLILLYELPKNVGIFAHFKCVYVSSRNEKVQWKSNEIRVPRYMRLGGYKDKKDHSKGNSELYRRGWQNGL